MWLSAWIEVQTCIRPSRCHSHSLSLASVKSRLVLPFWYRLTRVVPEKGPLNGCVYVCVYLYFLVLFCLTVSVKWLAVKAASEMTYIVSRGVLNSTPTNSSPSHHLLFAAHAHTVIACSAVIPMLCHLYLISLSAPYSEMCLFASTASPASPSTLSQLLCGCEFVHHIWKMLTRSIANCERFSSGWWRIDSDRAATYQ